ncbi:YDG domain-containing protein [Pseudochelatococcus sp. G4_1912]|uniref:YDG domain-containing protein n=1 Tax=Pseudochelatococcus sp. G4_1912 TaxID=3114288 RepID=UPI0039C64662
MLGGDSVTLGLTGTAYNSKDVATANTITGTYVLGGASAGNYQLTGTPAPSACCRQHHASATLTIATQGTVTTSTAYMAAATAAAKLTDGVLGAGADRRR